MPTMPRDEQLSRWQEPPPMATISAITTQIEFGYHQTFIIAEGHTRLLAVSDSHRRAESM